DCLQRRFRFANNRIVKPRDFFVTAVAAAANEQATRLPPQKSPNNLSVEAAVSAANSKSKRTTHSTSSGQARPPLQPAKVGMISLGCAKNLVDAEIMLGSVLERGMEITSSADDADVLVINTCAF